MRLERIGLAALVACAGAALAAGPAAASGGAQAARAQSCGSVPDRGGVGGPGVVTGEKFYYRVKVVKGSVPCKLAKSVISAWSGNGKAPAGWSCTNANPTRCTSLSSGAVVSGKFYGVKPKGS